MQTSDWFSRRHPAVALVYFVLVLGFGMFLLHPLCLVLSLLCALLCCAHFTGGASLSRTLRFALPLVLFAAVLNPLFNHNGATVLFYLPTGSPVTLESFAYGLAAAAMLCTVLLWFACFNAVMTTDKLLCLFGRAAPSLSLVLTMTLRLIPRFRNRLQAVRDAQRGLGRDGSGTPKQKLEHAVTLLSALTTWALENAVETADSMRSRGCGLPGRTSFALFRFGRGDAALLLWLLLCGGVVLLAALSGTMEWQYIPTLQGNPLSPLAAGAYTAYLTLCLTPVILNRLEEWKWNYLQSNI